MNGRHQLYGHLPPITKTIQVRRTRLAGHCWRSRDELIRDVLLWIPTHGRAKAGRPARTYIQQLCEDTGCCPEDLPRAMNDREEWRERVRDIRATSAIWWWYTFFPILKWGYVSMEFLQSTSMCVYMYTIIYIYIYFLIHSWVYCRPYSRVTRRFPFLIATTSRCREGALHLSLDCSTLALIHTLKC